MNRWCQLGKDTQAISESIQIIQTLSTAETSARNNNYIWPKSIWFRIKANKSFWDCGFVGTAAEH